MFALILLLPATGIIAGGWFVLFFSNQAAGGLRTFGKVLGVWMFILGGAIFIGALGATVYVGTHPEMRGMMGRHMMGHGPEGMMRHPQPAPDSSMPQGGAPAPEAPTEQK